MASLPLPGILGTLLPGFAGTDLPTWLEQKLRDGLAGVCLFGENIESTEQLAALTAAIRRANPHAIIAIDEEGGDVTRLYYDRGAPYPGNALLGRINELELTTRTARAVGWQLREVGVNVTFAPDADVNSNPDNPVIGVRSFGTDTQAVADQVAAWVSAVQATGVGAAAKHFPGHGDTAQDSHLALPIVDRSAVELRTRELVPFEAAIAAGTELIMTSHILLPQLDAANPATMSAPVLQGLLREQLGFEGVIVSDALDMAGASGEIGIPGAAVRALAAGVDLLCIGTRNTDEQLDEIVSAAEAALERGDLEPERVADAASRVRRLAERLADRAAQAPLPASPIPEPAFDLAQLAQGFDVSPRARQWIADAAGDYALLRADSTPNQAVGVVPWGVPERDNPGAKHVAVIGRDIHRRPGSREVVDRVRAEHGASALVVDMGWPSDDRAYADVATFGASRVVGAALLGLLAGADGGAR